MQCSTTKTTNILPHENYMLYRSTRYNSQFNYPVPIDYRLKRWQTHTWWQLVSLTLPRSMLTLSLKWRLIWEEKWKWWIARPLTILRYHYHAVSMTCEYSVKSEQCKHAMPCILKKEPLIGMTVYHIARYKMHCYFLGYYNNYIINNYTFSSLWQLFVTQTHIHTRAYYIYIHASSIVIIVFILIDGDRRPLRSCWSRCYRHKTTTLLSVWRHCQHCQ